MTEATSDEFKPTEIWTPNKTEFYLEPAILAARESMNRENTDELIHKLLSKVERDNGLAYAVLNGDSPAEYSSTDAIVMFDTFSVGPSANRLARAEFIRRVAKQAGVTDSDGKFKPVIFLASPGPGSNLHLSPEQRRGLKNGEMGIAAQEMLAVVRKKEIGQVALAGFSQGAAMAAAAARQAFNSGLDIKSLSVGDPPTVEARKPYTQLQPDFMKDTDFAPAIEATGLNIQGSTLNWVDMLRAGAGMLRPINHSIIKAMSSDTFEANVQELIDEGILDKIVVGYGSDSKITKPGFIEPALHRLSQRDTDEILTTIKVVGANHTWGDNLPVLAKLYLRALT